MPTDTDSHEADRSTDGGDTSLQFRKNSVGLSGVVGQSLSAMGLSGVIGTSVPVIAITAGAGGWLACGIAAVMILPIALSMSLLARRYATTGGLYGLTSKALGPLGGLLTGWLMVALIGTAAGTATLSFGIYFSQFLQVFGLQYNRLTLGAISVAALVVCWVLARVGARPAAWVMFVTEIAATVAMLVVFVAVLVVHRGQWIDSAQLHLQGTSLPVVWTAVVLAIAGFGGFESAAVYGKEAKNPTRVIPLAMVFTSVLAGLIWMFAGYVLYLGFQYSTVSLADSPAPMGTLADVAGISWYSYVVDLSLAFTIGASLIAVFSWVARMMYTMSIEGVAPKSWGRVHPRYRTPSAALAQAGVLWLTLIIVMSCISDTPLTTFGDAIGALSGYPLLLVYGLVCVAAIRYQWRQGKHTSVWIVVAAIGVASMAYVLYDNLTPWPTWPTNAVVIAFGVVTVGICILYVMLRERRPETLYNIGTSVVEGDDDESDEGDADGSDADARSVSS